MQATFARVEVETWQPVIVSVMRRAQALRDAWRKAQASVNSATFTAFSALLFRPSSARKSAAVAAPSPRRKLRRHRGSHSNSTQTK